MACSVPWSGDPVRAAPGHRGPAHGARPGDDQRHRSAPLGRAVPGPRCQRGRLRGPDSTPPRAGQAGRGPPGPVGRRARRALARVRRPPPRPAPCNTAAGRAEHRRHARRGPATVLARHARHVRRGGHRHPPLPPDLGANQLRPGARRVPPRHRRAAATPGPHSRGPPPARLCSSPLAATNSSG
jgi:hypothetical protein